MEYEIEYGSNETWVPHSHSRTISFAREIAEMLAGKGTDAQIIETDYLEYREVIHSYPAENSRA